MISMHTWLLITSWSTSYTSLLTSESLSKDRVVHAARYLCTLNLRGVYAWCLSRGHKTGRS